MIGCADGDCDRARPVPVTGGNPGAGPVELARLTLVRLVRDRESPVPETYCRVYREVAGPVPFAEAVCGQTRLLVEIAHRLLDPLGASHGDALPEFGRQARQLLAEIGNLAPGAACDRAADDADALGSGIRDRLLHGEAIATGVGELLSALARMAPGTAGDEDADDGSASLLEALAGRGVDPAALARTTECLRTMAVRQAARRRSMGEAQQAFKAALAEMLRQAGELVTLNEAHEADVASLAQRVEVAADPTALRSAVGAIGELVHGMGSSLRRTRDAMVDAQRRAGECEREIAMLRRKLADTTDQARRDSLTGVMNRTGFSEAWQREVADAAATGNTLALAMLDIDDFKHLNDSYGHKTGDDVLVHIVGVIRGALRGVDSVSRFGGEEFVVLLPETDSIGARLVLERLQRDLTRRFFLHDNERLLVTFSAGVTAVRVGDDSVDSAVSRADSALYAAKRAGKNRVCVA